VQIYARRQNVPALISEIEEFLRLHPDAQQAPTLRNVLNQARAFRPKP
jgi:hypothetical protein